MAVVGFPNNSVADWRIFINEPKVTNVSGELILSGEAMVRFSDGVRSTHSVDGAVILDVKRGQIFRLNLTGSRILQLLRSGAEEPEIACMLVREFSADPATAESDTNVFLTALRQNALIEPQSQK
jgi:hypothetical protein